jgi:energy-converting hydrogenase Eha subunit A
LLHIRPRLTPLAAAGLVVIMIGAVVTTIIQGPAAGAVVPAVVGVLAAYVARGRF